MVTKQDQYSNQIFKILFYFCIVLLPEHVLSPIDLVRRLNAKKELLAPDIGDASKHLTSKAHHSLVSSIIK